MKFSSACDISCFILSCLILVGIGGCNDRGTDPRSGRAPTITDVTPNSGPAGSSVLISGFGFGVGREGSNVYFNGAVAVPAQWADDAISTQVPAGATSGNITVAVQDDISNGVYFQVTGSVPVGSTPTVTDVRPNPADIGDRLRIHGINFGPESPVVTINGVQGDVHEWRSDEIRVYMPQGAVTGPLIVSCGGRSSAPYLLTINGTLLGGIFVDPANLSLSVNTSATVAVSGGTPPYALQSPPNSSVVTASLSGSAITLHAVAEGSTSLIVQDASSPAPGTASVSIAVTAQSGGVSFSRDIQPVFNANCIGCHGGSGGLYLTEGQSYGNLVNVQAQAGCTTEKRVRPGNAALSVLFKRISGSSCGDRMPKGGTPLPAATIQTIADWINAGALNN